MRTKTNNEGMLQTSWIAAWHWGAGAASLMVALASRSSEPGSPAWLAIVATVPWVLQIGIFNRVFHIKVRTRPALLSLLVWILGLVGTAFASLVLFTLGSSRVLEVLLFLMVLVGIGSLIFAIRKKEPRAILAQTSGVAVLLGGYAFSRGEVMLMPVQDAVIAAMLLATGIPPLIYIKILLTDSYRQDLNCQVSSDTMD